VKVGDLVQHNKPSTRAEFDAIGLVIEIREDWMPNWSKVKVLWQGDKVGLWQSMGSLRVFTSS
jgi:hypothetical protein